MILEINGEITPERMKGWSQSKNNTWFVDVTGDGSKVVKSDAVNSNIAQEPGMLDP